ncbi:hypothetical protein ACFPN2_15655 [Steroidobacter flavus]|uniref:Uncharacterized protein n=1 Tax=Steroidobacter flavus TaxID=1842136 RepID=A0ABV8SSR1_9GAMM
MYLEIERKLYTLAIATLALSSVVALVVWAPILSSETFVTLSRAVGSAKVIALAETACQQFLAALICVIPLKLTRQRLSILDALLVGLAVSLPTLLIRCDLPRWELVTVATGPLLFVFAFRALRSMPPSSWLDNFRSDQKPWLSIVFAAMFASQIPLVLLFLSGGGGLLRPSVLIAFTGAVLALLARRFNRVPLWIAAALMFAYDLSLYVSGWPKILALFGPASCPAL